MNGYDYGFNTNKFFFRYQSWFKLNDFKTDYTNAIVEGNPELFIPAGNLINAYCKNWNINQRMIIVSLQREQGLVQKKTKEEADVDHYIEYLDPSGEIKHYQVCPIDWALGVGVPDFSKPVQKWEGFKRQIEGACRTYRTWYDYWKPGMEAELIPPDKESRCVCETPLTYSLIRYTPHVEALALTEKIYLRYFPEGSKYA